MKTDYQFTQTEILNKIGNWELEPFTLPELNFLLKRFTFTDHQSDNPSFTFGENDIESFILETLSEMEIED